MADRRRIVFIHGAGTSGQAYKATVLRRFFPDLVAPDFGDDVGERLVVLEQWLGGQSGWTLIGSSLGGLTAALYALRHPEQVRKLILLAPALTLPEFEPYRETTILTPTLIIHGERDDIVPIAPVRALARRVFRNLQFEVVEDDHRLHRTVEALDWPALVG